MKRRALLWILALIISGAFCVYVAGNDRVGLFDRDEPRYAQTSRQMLQSGDWVVPRFLDKVRTAKPIFIYWCQAASMSVLGDNGFAARLPSAIGMTAVLGVVALMIWNAAGPRRGLWTAFILGTSGLAIASAKMCLTDGVLLLWITISQLCLYRLWRSGFGVIPSILLGLSVGLAAITKGPVALGVNATTLAALWLIGRTTDRERFAANFPPKRIALSAGIATVVLLATALPWVMKIEARVPGFLGTAIGHDVIDRMQRGQEGHAQPPGFYSLIVWGTFFPWSLLLPGAIYWGWRYRYLPQTRFALAAWVGPWVMFELIATKLPHYVLPTFPAMAYLIADLLTRADRRQIRDLSQYGFRIAVWIWAAIVSAVGLCAPLALFYFPQPDQVLAAAGICIATIAITMGVLVAKRFWNGQAFAAARVMGVGMFAIVLVLWLLYLPRLKPLRLSEEIASIIETHGGYAASGFMIDYKEPSLAFAQGGGLREQVDDHYLNTTSSDAWPKWIVLTQRVWNAAPETVKSKWEILGDATGVGYASGETNRRVLVIRKIGA